MSSIYIFWNAVEGNMILSKEKWGLKIFHSFANVSKFWLVFLLVAKNGMLLNSEVLFHRLEKDDMAKRKDRAGLDFNKLVLAMLLQTLFYHVIQNLLVVIPFLFYSFFFWFGGGGWLEWQKGFLALSGEHYVCRRCVDVCSMMLLISVCLSAVLI